MKQFQTCLILFLTLFGSVRFVASLTCSAPGFNSGTAFTCSNGANYISPSSFANFPLNTRTLTMIADLVLIRRSGSGCGGGYPYSLFLVTIEDSGGVLQEVVELEHTSATTFSYKTGGVPYNTETVAGGGFSQDNYYFVFKFSIDLIFGQVNMATTYNTVAHIGALILYSPYPADWKFDSTTKIWLGGGPLSVSRYEVSAQKISAWAGYLPYYSSYNGALILGHFATLIGDYKLREYQGYSLTDADGDAGTAYLGASTSGSPDTTNSPDWMGERAILKFTSAQFITLPAFTVRVTTAPSTSSFLFRYSDSGLTIDRFALKHDSSLNIQVCTGGVCQTGFPGSALNTWTHLSINWALRTSDASNYQGYYSVFKNGVLSRFQDIGTVPISATTISATNDKVLFGGFTGQLAAIKIYSPGSLQVNKPTWCTSSTCAADLGVSNPPTCLIPSSCDSSCDGCTDSTDLGCLACAAGKYFYQGKCGACPPGTFINVDYCQSCSLHCTSCSSASSCSACEAGFIVSGGSCVSACPANCNACDGGGQCLACNTNFLLYDNTCVSSCPTGSYQSGTNCLHCPTDCDVCVDGSTCTTCSSGKFLHNAGCVSSCPLTTYTLGTKCLGCPGDCNVCTDGNTCTTCASGHYLYNAGCVNSCPFTTYQNGGICSSCPNNCKICVDGATCSTCSNGFYLNGAGCVGSCPLKTFPSGGNCLGCPIDCDTCSDGTTCSLCTPPKYLHQSQCVGSCPIKTFTSGTNCLSCSSGCDTCLDANTCTVCTPPNYLFKKKCYSSCPLTSFQSGTSCLDCPSHCDVCIDGSTCTSCSLGSYFYNQACYKTCPIAAPYRSPTVDSTLCYQTCPTQTPYIYKDICYASCPPEAPSFTNNLCYPKDLDSTITKLAKLNNAAESTANTVLIARSIATPSTPTPLMFGSITKLLQYTRYMNISRSENLEKVFQAEDDCGKYIPMPEMSQRMQGAFETSSIPFVFERYGTSSSFLRNQGDNLLGVVTVFGLFVIMLFLQKGIFYVRNIPQAHFVVRKLRFFFQNYFIGQFYQMLGDVVFSAVLELKTVELTDKYSVPSFIICLLCLLLGGILVVANIWIVKKYQKQKNSHRDEKSREEALEEFYEKYKGIGLLFNDFEDASFTHQALLIFFVGRNILFCLIIVLFYSTPVLQCILLLAINLTIIGYYIWKRSIRSRMDYVEQLLYEVIILAVIVGFFIMALAEGSSGIINAISGIIIVLNIVCKFLALGFLAIRCARIAWEYHQAFKGIPQKTLQKKTATVMPAPPQIILTTEESNRPLDSSDRPSTLNYDKTFDPLNLESNMMDEQSVIVTQVDTRRRDLGRRLRVMPENSSALDQSSSIFQSEEPTKEVSPTHVNAPLAEIVEKRRRVVHVRNIVKPNSL